MSRLTEQEKSSIISADTSNHNEGSFNLDSLRKVLSGLENNVHAYEKMTGRQPQVKKGDDEDGNTLTGFTGRLVSAVNKVSRYLKENELRLKAETTLREQLHSDVIYLKTLVDTLTNDIITTQEQYISLQSEFLSYRNETMDQLKAIKQGLESRGIQIHPVVFPVPQKPAVFPSAHAELLARSNLGSNTMQMHDAILNHEHFDEGSSKNTLQQSSSRETSSMKTFDDQTGINSMNGSVQSAVALGLPQQSDSPKTISKQRSRIQDDQSSTMAHPKRISYINQSSNTQEMSNGQTTQLSYSQQPLYDHLRQAGAVTISERNPYLVKNNENNAGAFQPLLSDSQRFSDSGIRGTVDVSGIQGSFQNKPGNWSGTVHMEDTGTGLLQGTGTGLLHLSEQKPITSLPQHNVGSNLSVEPTLRSFELEAMARTGFENVGHSNINQPKSSGEKLTADIPTEMSSHLEKQIEELNKQHAEAQSKLQQLMYQQEVVENKMSTKNQQLVSPPISPITVESDADSQPSLSQHSMCQQYTARNVPNSAGYQQQHKQIRVSLPRMENIIDNQS